MPTKQNTMPPLPSQPGIEFRHCPGRPGYAVDSLGNVWSCRKVGRPPGGTTALQFVRRWRQLAPFVSRGHHRVHARSRGKYQSPQIHTLVLEAFTGPCPDDMGCRHLNGVATDNRPKNLMWGTQKENCADTVRHGRSTRGSRNSQGKLRAEQVREIRALAKRHTLGQLAERFGVCFQNISMIINRKTWAWLK